MSVRQRHYVPKRKKLHKFLALLLAVTLLFSSMPISMINVSAAGGNYKVYIQERGAELYTLDVNSADTILSLKNSIAERSGIAVESQRLVFGGRSLENDNTLSDYNIQNEATIHLIVTVDFSGGTGTVADPFKIANADDIAELAEKVNAGESYSGKYFIQIDDIVITGDYETIGIYTEDFATYYFKGKYDAGIYEDGVLTGNYTISGTIDKSGDSSNGVGIFGYTKNATIKNLTVECTVNGYDNVAGIVGCAYYTTITNCNNIGDVTGSNNYVGGIVGRASYTTITNCYNEGEIIGKGEDTNFVYVGGIAGENSNSSIVENCYNTGNIESLGNYVGGVVGYNSGKSAVTNCYNTGKVTGVSNVGGVVGLNTSASDYLITNCYNTGNVNGVFNVGGVVGGNSGGTLTNCYNIGDVTGTDGYIGGVVGYNRGDSTVTNCYYNSENIVSTADLVIVDGVTSKTTAEMTTAGFVALLNAGGTAFSYQALTRDYESSTKVLYYPGLEDGNDTTATYYPSVTFDITAYNTWTDVALDVTEGVDYEWTTATALTIKTEFGLAWLAYQTNLGSSSGYDCFSGVTVTLEKDLDLTTIGVVGYNLDVDADGAYTNLTADNSWIPIGRYETTNPFQGTFYGNEKTITGVYINASSQFQGLFGVVNGNATIQDLTVNANITNTNWFTGALIGYLGQEDLTATIENCHSNGTINGSSYVGGLIGHANTYSSASTTNYITITNCSNTADVTGTAYDVGGIVGGATIGRSSCKNSNFTIKNCNNTGSIQGARRVGGIVGIIANSSNGTNDADGTLIENCYNTGDVTAVSSGSYKSYVGGIVGEAFDNNSTPFIINNCYNTGDIIGDSSTECLGGIAGCLDEEKYTVTNSYNTGDVIGSNEKVGGVVGYNYKGTVTNSYNTGDVTGTKYVGGAVGYNTGTTATVSYSYNIGEVTGSSYVGGAVGCNYGTVTNTYYNKDVFTGSTSNGTGLTTAQMTGLSNDDDYDMAGITTDNWTFTEDKTDTTSSAITNTYTYPVLTSNTQNPAPSVVEVINLYTVEITLGSNMTLSSSNNSDDIKQTVEDGTAITSIVITADTGYGFPTDYLGKSATVTNGTTVLTTNGVTITRDSSSQITISGTPTADFSSTLTGISASINVVTPTITNALVGATYTYGATVTALDGTATTDSGTISYQWYSSSDNSTWTAISGETSATYTPSSTTVGTTYYKVIATNTITDNGDGGTKTATASSTATIVVGKITPTVTAPTANTLTYTGSAQALVTTGSTNGGTMYYSTNGTDYSTTVPTATNAGIYTVHYKVVGNNTYNDVSASSVSVTISAKSVAVSWTVATSYTYAGSALTAPTASFTDVNGKTVSLTVTKTTSNDFINVGEYNFEASTIDTNYSLTNTTQKVTIRMASNSITSLTIDGWDYGEYDIDKNSPSVTATFGADKATFKYYSDEDCKNEVTDIVSASAGTYYIKATIAETDNYKVTTLISSFKISSKTLTTSNLNITGVTNELYTGSAITQDNMVVTYGDIKLDSDDYSVSYENNKEVGTATVNITFKGNYTGTASTTFTISYGTATSGMVSYDSTNNGWYNDDFAITAVTDYTISTSPTGTFDSSITVSGETADGSITYYVKDSDGKIYEGTYTYKTDETAPTVAVEIESNSFKAFINTITFNLFFKNNVDVTITGTDALSGVASVEYQKVATTNDYDADGVWTTGTSFSVTPNETFVVYAKVTDNAGNATIVNSTSITAYTDSTAKTDSFDFVKSGEDTSKTVEVELNGNTIKSIMYNERTVDTANYIVSEEVDGVTTITFLNSYIKGFDRGSHTFTINYNPLGETYVDAQGNESPTSTTVTANIFEVITNTTTTSQSTVYNNDNQSPTVPTADTVDETLTIMYQDDNGEYTLTDILSFTNVGKYTVNYELSADNHTKTTGTITFEITKADTSIVITEIDNSSYENNITLTATVSGVNGEIPTGTVVLYSGELKLATVDVGSDGTATYTMESPVANQYSITAEFISSDDNYSDSKTASATEFDITKANQEIEIAEVTGKIYGDDEFKLSITGQKDTGKVTYTVAEDNGVIEINGDTVTIIGAGTVTITATVDGDNNYNSDSATYDLTVAKKAVTVKIDSHEIVRGMGIPTLTGTSSNDNVIPKYSATADNMVAGEYEITMTNSSDYANYDITVTTGKLTITTGYTVSFDDAKVADVAYGTTVTQPTAPTKDGYIFKGWFIGEDEFDFETLITKDLEITSLWEKVVEKEVEVAGDADVKIEAEVEEQLKNELFTDEEVAQNVDMKVTVKVDVVAVENMDETTQKEFDSYVEEYNTSLEEGTTATQAIVFDISVIKSLAGVEENITNLETPITITIDIPEEYQDADRDFFILRNHEGEITILEDLDTDPTTITIETDRFSNYTLNYIELSADTDTDTDTEEDTDSPETGDNSSAQTLIMLMFVSMLGVFVVVKKRLVK